MADHIFTIHATVPAPFNIGGGNPMVTNAESYGGAIPGIFDGMVAGSTLTINKDDTLIVRLINDLPHATGIHWHGFELDNYSDGTEITQNEVPGAPLQTLGNGVPAGGTFLYKFKVPRSGIFWFHPHHHNSTDSVFRGQYGIVIVKDTEEISLVSSGVLPNSASTHQFVLSDITVCKAVNDALTYPAPTAAGPEWLSGQTSQNGHSPLDLCVTNPLNPDGSAGASAFAAGQIPITFRQMNTPGTPPTVEGQTVLTNGANVGGRIGTPLSAGTDPGPGALVAGYTSISAQPGQGLRFQIANTATTRYFRLILTTAAGAKIDLIRVGGEGGVLNHAVREGGMKGTYVTKYTEGEILVPPATRVDVVAVIPLGTNNTTCTMWTRDFQRTGNGYSRIPTVPVLHIDVGNTPVSLFPMADGTALKSTTANPITQLGAPTSAVPFLDSVTIGKIGAPSVAIPTQDISLTTAGAGATGINGVQGMFHVPPGTEYTTIPHIGSTRYAKNGDILQFNVVNSTSAHHPFHLHGFSFQPVSLKPNVGAIAYTWPAGSVEYVDTFDIPSGHTMTFKVHISDRPLADGLTIGGAFGRWFFHCHIFFHAHKGMISELVITDGSGNEKPNVNVNGSWAYSPKPGMTNRTGTYVSTDGRTVNLTAHLANGTPIGVLTKTGTSIGTWNWDFDSEAAPTPAGIYYVYVTGTDTPLGLKDQAVFRLKVGTPDDGSDNGDPHIHTVDGKRYDFQAVGEFTVLKDNEGLEVQARQSPVLTANPYLDPYTGIKSCVSMNTGVALRVGSHRISYQYGGREQLMFFVDGKQTKPPTQGLNLDGNVVSTFVSGGNQAIRVDYLHHPVVIITPRFWTPHKIWYFSISISRTQADQGIMGPIPSGTWLPLLPTGASVGPMPNSINDRFITLYKTFGKAWRLTDQNSLFVYEDGASTSTYTDTDWPSMDPPCEIKKGLGIPEVPVFEGMPVEKATEICKLVTDKGLNKDCVFDVATTGDKSFAEMYLDLQEIRQTATAVQIGVVKPGVITTIVSTLIGNQPVPKGSVTFYVNGEEKAGSIELDKKGRAEWKIKGLDKGTYKVKAVYNSANAKNVFGSSSPVLTHTINDDQKNIDDPDIRKDPNNPNGQDNEGCIRKYWILGVLIILLILLIIWLVF